VRHRIVDYFNTEGRDVTRLPIPLYASHLFMKPLIPCSLAHQNECSGKIDPSGA